MNSKSKYYYGILEFDEKSGAYRIDDLLLDKTMLIELNIGEQWVRTLIIKSRNTWVFADMRFSAQGFLGREVRFLFQYAEHLNKIKN